ncbi:MAG: GH92 family glycosyl hydrolase, partial [Bacteroidetes bacterium]|nr:GH92 family glycosyl hydrolase [Bacteroidota bacterium]
MIVCALASLGGSCSAQRAQDFSSALVRYVDPFIGTGGHGHTYPGATVPSGMIQISPDSRNGTWDGCAGYHYSDSTLLGFSHKHLSGTGMGDLGDLLLMPTHARGAAPAYFPARFSHEREQAEAGYYAVELPENNIRVELTATMRAGFHRYTHPATEPLDLAIDLVHGIEDSPTEGLLTVLNDSTIVGHRMSTGWARTQRLYFVLQFSRRLKSWRTNADGVLANGSRNTRGTNVRAVVEFPEGVSELLVRVGISGVSIDGAIRNLKAEIPHWDFGATRREASAAWEKELRKFAVTSEDEAAKKVFYTAVYHTLLAPVLFNDVDGSYRGGDGAIHTSTAFNNYHIFSLWDTFRTLHPLYTITQPRRTEDIVQSILAFGREYGLLPVWAFEGNETNTMIGYHSVPVIVDAYMKGVRGIDPDETFAALKKISQQKQRGLQFYSMQEPKDIEVRWSELRKERVEPDPEWWTESIPGSGELVPGYAESLSGESIQYRSLYPDVKDALLVRAQEGKSIQWKTAPVPAGAGNKPVTFIWAMGVASMRGAHTFRLRVNGEEWFTFTTSLDGTQTYWKRRSQKGAELVFQAQWRDEYNDLFGHMYLSVPPQILAPGTQAVIDVQGDSA